MTIIEHKNLFFDHLLTGINLFIGAGFAILESPSGQRLPVGCELAKELCEKFQLNKTYADDLTRISAVLKRNRKEDFYAYLKNRYTVHDYNSLYNTLNKIKLGSVITTNIDNLIPAVMDKSAKYYLNNLKYYGPAKKDGFALPYIPLHGDVLDDTSDFIFGKFELADANNINRSLFEMMFGELVKRPTLFWGYGFNDGGVEALIGRILEEGKQTVWVQVRTDDEAEFYKDLGCNVIVADTEALLKEIDIKLKDNDLTQMSINGTSQNEFWNKLAVPSINQVESLPISDFYQQGKTHWYYALADKAYPTNFITTVIDAAVVNKNTIIVGIPLGGKTMLLMQIACRIKKTTYFVSELNDEKAKLICNNVHKGMGEYIILVDNCAEDMKAYKRLASCPGLRTIAVSDDYMYESSKHILENVNYKKLEIPDFEENEARRIYSNIPQDLRKKFFSYKKSAEDKYSVLELVSANIKNIISSSKVCDVLKRIKLQNYEVFEIILLTAYLVKNKSALTTDVLAAYFNTSDYGFIKSKIEMVSSYLTELNVALEEDDVDQDYYTLRSTLFVMHTFYVALTTFKDDFAKIIRKFVGEVPPSYIYKNHVFKRSAYDAQTFVRLFDNNADELYKILYKFDPSAYTLQQQALYKAYTNRYPEAFSIIDTAIHEMPGNFSIKNARAIILFEANKDKNTTVAIQAKKEAMAILEQCYTSDKRKIYHAQKYAEFALLLSKHNEKEFLGTAYQWISELVESGESTSSRTRNLYKELKRMI